MSKKENKNYKNCQDHLSYYFQSDKRASTHILG